MVILALVIVAGVTMGQSRYEVGDNGEITCHGLSVVNSFGQTRVQLYNSTRGGGITLFGSNFPSFRAYIV